MAQIGLYLHFPFCRQKCHYCSLFSRVGLEKLIPVYVAALKQDLFSYQLELSHHQITTLYIGGGTPSIIPMEQFKKLLVSVLELANISTAAEITIEANPESLNLNQLKQYFNLGINRLSLGLQAKQDYLLTKMGRQASYDRFLQSLTWAKQAGFKNINADLIFGLPDQTMSDWEESLQAVIDAQLQHVACYSLEVDERSTWGRWAAKGQFETVPAELDRQMANLAVQMLGQAGLKQYEISNFAQPGFECQHNLNFWHGQEYIGLGAGAHSFFLQNRYQNTQAIPEYIKQMESHDFHRIEKHEETESMARDSFIMQSLRLTQGLSLLTYQHKFKESLLSVKAEAIEKLIGQNLIEINEQYLRLTALGRDVENQVVVELLT
jgi:oxygen-independent coproporphyrinogen-3 oxidase